ncbi:MAG TPA: cation-efflux pump [Anaerolineae bacterium]|nr:cation-efflux pump [Anaerolineae bacterium]
MPSADYHLTVRRVLIQVLLINALVTAVKFVVGALSGSLAVLADAFNALIDSSSNVIGLLGIRAASGPPDADHPYGHRRYETLATLAIGGLLLLAGWEIIENVMARLLRGGAPTIEPLSLTLLTLTVPINLFIVWYEGRRGRALHSEVLLADATQTRVNVWTTLAAFAGLLGGRLGLPWLDLVSALGITLVIGREAWRILRATLNVLSDSAALDPGRVEQVAQQVPGVRYATEVRSRGREDDIHLDLHVKVDAAMSTTQAHAIASEVERRLKTDLPGVVDAVVHVEPGHLPPPTRWDAIAVQVRAIADGLGLGVHNLHMHPSANGYTVDVDVEVDAALSLEASHRQVTEFENRVRAALSDVVEIATHIEPMRASDAPEIALDAAADRVRAQIVAIGDQLCGPGATHHITLRRTADRYDASLHVIWAGDSSIIEAHLVAEELERQLREVISTLDQVTVHVEPPEGRDD